MRAALGWFARPPVAKLARARWDNLSVVAIAPADRTEPATGLLPLPPGSLPVDPVRAAVGNYMRRPTVANADRVAEAINVYAEVLEVEIARKAVGDLAEFMRCVRRLELLETRISTRVAQWRWLQADGRSAPPAVPLRVRRVDVPRLLEALREVELDRRLVAVGAKPAPRKRGRGRAMAALADAGCSSVDVGLELGDSPGNAWAMLVGNQPPAPGLRAALERCVGVDVAALVMNGIPEIPRGRPPASGAHRALHAAGVRVVDLAALVPVKPGTMDRWLRGTLRPSPRFAIVLAEQLGAEQAREVLALIPPAPPRIRAACSPALKALQDAGGSSEQLAALIPTTEGTTRRYLAGTAPAPSGFGDALAEHVGAEQGRRVLALIPSHVPRPRRTDDQTLPSPRRGLASASCTT